MAKYDLRRVVSFHGRVKRARDFSAEVPDVIRWMPEGARPEGPVWTSYVSGEMSAGQRDVRLRRFRHLEAGERALLANARCLAEGVDVPSIDAVAFIDPRRSQIDIIQAVGRAIRRSEEKTKGTVVLPVFVDPNEDAEIGRASCRERV